MGGNETGGRGGEARRLEGQGWGEWGLGGTRGARKLGGAGVGGWGHGDWRAGVKGVETGGQGWGHRHLGGRGGGWCWQRQRQPQSCHLSSSDTQYKMTISMADWPSEASEVRWWSSQAPGHPPLGWGTGLGTGLQSVCPSTRVSQGAMLGTQQ